MFKFKDIDGQKSVDLVEFASVLTCGLVSDHTSLLDLFKRNPRVGQLICDASALLEHCANGNKLY